MFGSAPLGCCQFYSNPLGEKARPSQVIRWTIEVSPAFLGIRGIGVGMHLLGHDIPGHPDGARVVSADGAGGDALYDSGALMLAGALLAGAKMPCRREWVRTSLNGMVILGIGNSCLAVAETIIPSGLAALMITIGPFWMLGLDAALPPRVRLHGPTIAGLVVGMAGAALLVGPGAVAGGMGSNVVKGFLILQLGCFGWSLVATESGRRRRHRSSAGQFNNATDSDLYDRVSDIGSASAARGWGVDLSDRFGSIDVTARMCLRLDIFRWVFRSTTNHPGCG